MEELTVGDLVNIQDTTIGVVERILSNSKAILRSHCHVPASSNQSFVILPKLDHSKMYSRVTELLGQEGRAIGIFPEGGSHDQPFLQPFHSGVAIMALKAIAKYPVLQTNLKIVPVGLNYFHPHKFRSRAAVEFGDPISVGKAIADSYLHGGTDEKRTAVSSLSQEIRNAILRLTVNSPSPELNRFLNAACRMYKPNGQSTYSVYDRLDVMKQFSRCISLFDSSGDGDRDCRLFKGYFEKVNNFLAFLSRQNISLRQLETYIESPHTTGLKSWFEILLFLPGLVVNSPSLFFNSPIWL